MLANKGQGPALALAKGDHDAALPGLHWGAATINAVLFEVGRADMAARV